MAHSPGSRLPISMAQPRGRACFCLSKAREDGHDGTDEAETSSQRLRAELEGLKFSALRSRAKASGAAAEEIREACDAEDAEGAMVALILVRAQKPGGGGATAALRGELEALKSSALRRRAAAVGVGATEMEAAGDMEDTKAAMIELILAREPPPDRVAGEATAAALRGSLAGVKTSQLRKRCVAAGVSEEDLEVADDAADSHAALVELLLAHEQAHEQVEQAHEQVEPDAGLRAELEGMRKGALRKRAVAAGVDESAQEQAADDAEDSKAALVALVLEQEAGGAAAAGGRPRDGPAGRTVSALNAGGETAADALSGALDHAMDVLEQLSVSSPRKSRRSVFELMESVDELSELMDSEWCDGVSRCSSERLEALVSDAGRARLGGGSACAGLSLARVVSAG